MTLSTVIKTPPHTKPKDINQNVANTDHFLNATEQPKISQPPKEEHMDISNAPTINIGSQGLPTKTTASETKQLKNEKTDEQKNETAIYDLKKKSEKPDTVKGNKIELQPLLKGKYFYSDKGKLVWEGKWGMNERAFLPGGYLSKFHYQKARGLEPSESVVVEQPIASGSGNEIIPQDGYYNGYFFMGSSVPNSRPTRHSEKGILIKFELNASANEKTYTVKGGGKNQFGSFTLQGKLNTKTGEMDLYRTYVTLSPRIRRVNARMSVHNHTRTSTAKPSSKMKRSASLPDDEPGPLPGMRKTSRCGRIRRIPSHLTDISENLYSRSDLFTRMLQTLDAVTSADPNKWFLHPVNAKELGLTDYHTVIRRPMDLGTVRKRLWDGVYKTAIEFSSDVRLTFQNAMRYNPPKHPVHDAADGLLKLFERKYKELLKESKKQLNGASQTTGSRRTGTRSQSQRIDHDDTYDYRDQTMVNDVFGMDGNSRDDDIGEMRMQIDLMNDELRNLQDKPYTPTHGMPFFNEDDLSNFMTVDRPPKRSRSDSAINPFGDNLLVEETISFEEKQRLAHSIQSLPGHRLQEVLEYIKSCGYEMPGNDDELELDFDILDATTLRKVEEMVMQTE